MDEHATTTSEESTLHLVLRPSGGGDDEEEKVYEPETYTGSIVALPITKKGDLHWSKGDKLVSLSSQRLQDIEDEDGKMMES